MLIFFYHKVSLLRRNDEDKYVGEAIRLLFCKPKDSKDMQLVLSITCSMVYEDNFELKQGRRESDRVDVVGVESCPRVRPSHNQGRFGNDSRVSFADSSEIAYEMKKKTDMAVGEKRWSGNESNSLAAASTAEHSNPYHVNASLLLGRFSGFSSLNGMLSLFSSGRSTNNVSAIRECNNGNGEADTNSNAGLSFGGEDSFQNDDMLSY